MSPWPPTADELHVVDGPDPGGAGGFFRAFGQTLRGLKTTLRQSVAPSRRLRTPRRRSRSTRASAAHRLHKFEDTGLEKCVGCSLCAAACPSDCIRVVAAENTPDNRVSAGERYAAVYEINLSPLHLLRLLRGRVPVRRDHDGQ